MNKYLECRAGGSRDCTNCRHKIYCDLNYFDNDPYTACRLVDKSHPLYKKCTRCPHKKYCLLATPDVPTCLMPRRCFYLTNWDELVEILIERDWISEEDYYFDKLSGHYALRKWSVRLQDYFWRFVDWMF